MAPLLPPHHHDTSTLLTRRVAEGGVAGEDISISSGFALEGMTGGISQPSALMFGLHFAL